MLMHAETQKEKEEEAVIRGDTRREEGRGGESLQKKRNEKDAETKDLGVNSSKNFPLASSGVKVPFPSSNKHQRTYYRIGRRKESTASSKFPFFSSRREQSFGP